MTHDASRDPTPGAHGPLPLTDAEAAAEAQRLITDAYQPPPPAPAATFYRDPRPLPEYGPTPPTPQPGRPPMSQKATDASALLLTGSIATVATGGSASLVLLTLGTVDPVTLGIAGGSATAVLLALAGLIHRAGRAVHTATQARPEIHHHYAGPVTQKNSTQHVTARPFGKANGTVNHD